MRTEEQIAADENLTAAIERCLEAYFDTNKDGLVLSDFVVLTSINRIETDGDITTAYPMLMRDGDIQWYRVLGLINIHSVMSTSMIQQGSDNG